MDLISVLQKVRDKFLKESPFEEQTYNNHFEYQDKLSEMIFLEHGIIYKENLEAYLNEKHVPDHRFAGAVSVYGGTYQSEFASLLYSLFCNVEKAAQILKMEEFTNTSVLCKLEKCITNLYEKYKDYLVNLVQFYKDNLCFEYPLDCYPQTMLSEPFNTYLESDIQFSNYNNDTRTLLYLQLIEKIVFARFLELNEETSKKIKTALLKFTKSDNPEIAKIANRTREKLYHYNGVKCPDHLIFISLLSGLEAEKLAEYTIKFYEKSTNKNALKLAYMGRLVVMQETKGHYAKNYRNNPFYYHPIVIKKKQRGYVAYIFDYLEKQNYIIHDNKWDSIAKHQYFKTRKSNGNVDFVTANEMSQSLGYKMQRANMINNKTGDKELDSLIEFLKGNFISR